MGIYNPHPSTLPPKKNRFSLRGLSLTKQFVWNNFDIPKYWNAPSKEVKSTAGNLLLKWTYTFAWLWNGTRKKSWKLWLEHCFLSIWQLFLAVLWLQRFPFFLYAVEDYEFKSVLSLLTTNPHTEKNYVFFRLF